MKKLLYLTLINLIIFSCQDVIEVDLPAASPRLVIDASINWFKETTGNNQVIKLTLTAPFFDSQVPPANNAIVTITDTSNNIYSFIEDVNTGIYKNNDFVPVLNAAYQLNIFYNQEVYTAIEKFIQVSPIEYVEQKNDAGFSGNDTEIKAYFMDPIDQDNFYFFEFIPSTDIRPSIDTFKDEFVNGNEIFGYYVEEDLTSGDNIIIRNYGVSRQFYEFMFILLQQTDNESGDPFETQPATVRGNCINQTNPDNFPLGYFRLSEADQFIYNIE
jgi:hypothetical protein